jgi:hypothetical protein
VIDDSQYHDMMQLARRLAEDGHGERAQFLRDCIDDARRFRWLAEKAVFVDMVADPDNLVQVWHDTLTGWPTSGRTLREAVDQAMNRHNRTATDGP